ncbi:SGNH/GDSL hydrolase family protein [Actinoplanes hulinensis]|uniref:SGNH/GDSL hydrolase family protein n=1 Tax=Actinoplanes hulinensis TaxID=1144547 RepID=A0ABS7AYL4_9ACTN|nr:SGNH/GDSL hydrolase family protein [Actinoplanes hulinensis]MBW6433861.1 SGNH/GDSL hydrolase family protein [Actinoplanes hulinensis]
MRGRWTAAVAGGLALLTAVTVSACSGAEGSAAEKAVEARDYVALGDSYAAGVGAGNYGDTECKQSKDGGYPQLWVKARAATPFGAVTDATCGGAVIDDVQFNQLTELDENTGWVTLTVGGNDAGWFSVLQQCIFGDGATCRTSVDKAATSFETTMPARLDTLYQAIRNRAPNAKVYVVGYPHLVADPGKGGVSCDSLTDAHRKALNAGADTLDELIKARVAAHQGFTFVDVREAFKGHEACTGEPWIHSVRDDFSESYHPTADGYQAYLRELVAVTG